MRCRAAVALCWALLGKQVVTRREVRLLHERADPTADEEGPSDAPATDPEETQEDEESLDRHYPPVALPTDSLDKQPMTYLGNPIASIPDETVAALTFTDENEEQKKKLQQELARTTSDMEKAQKRSAIFQAHGENLSDKKKKLEQEIADIDEWMKIAPDRKWTPPTSVEKEDVEFGIPKTTLKFPAEPMTVTESLRESLPGSGEKLAEAKGGAKRDLKKQIATLKQSIAVLRDQMHFPQTEEERKLIPLKEGMGTPDKNNLTEEIAERADLGDEPSAEAVKLEKDLQAQTDAEPPSDEASLRALFSLWDRLAVACRSRSNGDPCQHFLPGVASEKEVAAEQKEEEAEKLAED